MLAPRNNLAINKGDSVCLKMNLFDENENIVILEENAMIYFTVKEDPYSTEYVFQKYLNKGINFNKETNTYTIEIEGENTNSLFYKDYFYDIAIVRNFGLESANKKDKTTVMIGDFTVGHVATFKENEVK